MNEGIQTVSFNKTHRLTAKSTVSLEMPVATQKLQGKEGMPAPASLEADFLRAEAILAEMREIRGCLEHSLETLVPRD
ncbi:hypothetical protein [Chlamydia crocodili]|uniref:hypothetical protein n=1 Tax=Chlamydia crocodili TaxID=2766982 RepID=UPI0037DD4C91